MHFQVIDKAGDDFALTEHGRRVIQGVDPLIPRPAEVAREIVQRARVELVHGGCNVPGYNGGITVFFEDDDWRDLLAALESATRP